MAGRDPRHGNLHGNILSRDQDGNEHLLSVFDHPAGVVRIADDQMVRIMSPRAAVALVLELVHAMCAYLPVKPGPFSGRL